MVESEDKMEGSFQVLVWFCPCIVPGECVFVCQQHPSAVSWIYGVATVTWNKVFGEFIFIRSFLLFWLSEKVSVRRLTCWWMWHVSNNGIRISWFKTKDILIIIVIFYVCRGRLTRYGTKSEKMCKVANLADASPLWVQIPPSALLFLNVRNV